MNPYITVEEKLKASDKYTRVILTGLVGIGILALILPSAVLRLGVTLWFLMP